MCEHAVIGVVDPRGNTTLIVPAAAPQPALTAPVTSTRERQLQFTKAGVYAPQSTGMQFCFCYLSSFLDSFNIEYFYLVGQSLLGGNKFSKNKPSSSSSA